MRPLRNANEATLCGLVVSVVLMAVFYLMHGELPPLWLALTSEVIIMLPIVIWSVLREEQDSADVPRETSTGERDE